MLGIALLSLVASCGTSEKAPPVNPTTNQVADPGPTEKEVMELVARDLRAGQCRLLCSAYEPVLNPEMEVPGLDQKEVDTLMQGWEVKLEFYFHNGHEWIVGENGIDTSEQDRKWAYAELYNRCLYKTLTTTSSYPKKGTPNQPPSPARGTPAAGAPVAPPPGAAGR